MMDNVEISIVIPAFNEAANLAGDKLDRVYEYLGKRNQSFELIIADDGSTDSTLETLKNWAQNKPEVSILPLTHRGKGPTVQKAMLTAQGKVRLFTDFDQSTPIEEFEKLWSSYNQGYDVAIGSREIPGAKRDDEPWYRHLMGKVFNLVVQILAVRGIKDTQCGFKLFSARATEALFPRLKVTILPKADAFTGAMDVELLFLARKRGFKIKEVPITWKHVQSLRVSPIKDSIRMFVEVIKIRWAYLRGDYE